MKYFSLFSVVAALCVLTVVTLFNMPIAAFAQAAADAAAVAAPAPTVAETAMQQVCVGGSVPLPAMVAMIVAGLVTASSALANFVSADSFLGKVLHWFALNVTVKSKT